MIRHVEFLMWHPCIHLLMHDIVDKCFGGQDAGHRIWGSGFQPGGKDRTTSTSSEWIKENHGWFCGKIQVQKRGILVLYEVSSFVCLFRIRKEFVAAASWQRSSGFGDPDSRIAAQEPTWDRHGPILTAADIGIRHSDFGSQSERLVPCCLSFSNSGLGIADTAHKLDSGEFEYGRMGV